MVPLILRQMRNVRDRDHASMPPTENELTGAKRLLGEDSLAFGPSVLHRDIGDHVHAMSQRLRSDCTVTRVACRRAPNLTHLGRSRLAATGVEVAAAGLDPCIPPQIAHLALKLNRSIVDLHSTKDSPVIEGTPNDSRSKFGFELLSELVAQFVDEEEVAARHHRLANQMPERLKARLRHM